MKAFKIAYITEQLDLNAIEAEKFWPIYNEFGSKIEALRKESRSNIFEKIKGENINNLSEAEANVIINDITLMKDKELQYRKDLLNELKSIIPSIKILKLERAEDNFKKKLLKRLKKHREKRE